MNNLLITIIRAPSVSVSEVITTTPILITRIAGGPSGPPGAYVVSAVFNGDDIDFMLSDETIVSLVDAKIDLKGDPGMDGKTIVSVAFVGDDIVFTLNDDSTVTLVNAKIQLKGNEGDPGDPGIDGNTILNGSGVPASGLGVDGDFYIDTTADEIYGPKSGGVWGSGVDMIGPEGDPGAPGMSRFTFVLHRGENATVGVNKTNTIIVERACTITKAYAYAVTAPTGAALIFDINVNGTTIWSTQANRLQIAAGQNSGTQTSFNTTALAEGDLITIDIDQIGSTLPGADITVVLKVE